MSTFAEGTGSSAAGGPDVAALAETLIAALLRRLDRQGRNPDLWESWHVLMALQASSQGKYREAIHWIGAALLPENLRSGPTTKSTATIGGLRLETLRALFEGVSQAPPRRAA